MSFETLLGQPTAHQTLTRALSLQRVHHAYRFEGPAGVGKETAALLLAQALVCETSSAGACGRCSACRRAVTFTADAPHVPQHPDVVLLERGLYPASSLGGASEATGISVEQIRRIVLSRVGFPPHENRALVFIIRAAEQLTNSAANALLKTLEEPQPGTHFILLSSRPSQLLDTVISRTLAVRFGPLPIAAMRQLLPADEFPDEVLEFAQGSLEKARALARPEVRKEQDDFLKALDEAIAEGSVRSALTFAEKRPDERQRLLRLLSVAQTAFASRARSSVSGHLWATRYAEIARANQELEANGSPALVLEAMMVRMMQA